MIFKGDDVSIPKQTLPTESKAGNLYFIDVPGSKQSVIMIGKLAVSATDENAQ